MSDPLQSSSFQEPMGDVIGHHGAESTPLPAPPPSHLPPTPPPISPTISPTIPPPISPTVPPTASPTVPPPISPTASPPSNPAPSVVAEAAEATNGFSDHELTIPNVGWAELEAVSEPVSKAAATGNTIRMEGEASEPVHKPGNFVQRVHRGFVDSMISFFGSWWGVLIVIAVVFGLIVGLLAALQHKRKDDGPTPHHPAPAPAPPSEADGRVHHPPPPSGEEVTVYLAWEARRDPTRDDKIILFNVGSPDIAWSCCAESVFKHQKEVHVRLPPGSYAARTVHESGLQQVCSLETARRVAFTDAATRCSEVASMPASTEIDLGVCDTIVTN